MHCGCIFTSPSKWGDRGVDSVDSGESVSLGGDIAPKERKKDKKERRKRKKKRKRKKEKINYLITKNFLILPKIF